MAGCADSHGRGTDAGLETDARTLADAGEIVGRDAGHDAPEPSEPCAMGRRETVIEAPLARQAGFYVLLVEPHVTSRGDRVSAAAEVVSRAHGGIGVSDIVTADVERGELRSFFTSDLPYVLGSEPREEFLASGGFFEGARVYAEVRRFDVTRFDVQTSEDVAGASPEPRRHFELDPSDTNVPHFEIARDGDRAIFVSSRHGLAVLDVSRDPVTEIDRSHEGGITLYFPAPRISPSGARVAFVAGERRTLWVRDLADGAERSIVLPVDPVSLAFLGEDRLLVMTRPADGTLLAVDLRDGTTRPLAVGLAAESDRYTESLDVTADGRTLVVTEEQGARLRVVRCDPALVSFAGP
ncbi:MAG: hypothetical protein K1X94_20195 [Sandaracinaceae bacterium]|nr:hypothetical protein [Sandaracinaceae bacterium]